MDIWTIFIQSFDLNIYEVEIDCNKTFGELRKKVSEILNVKSANLLLLGQKEYDYKFNSIKIKEIDGIYAHVTLFPVIQCPIIEDWKIYIFYLGQVNQVIISCDETFGQLRKIVSDLINVNINNLKLIIKGKVFDYRMDSKIIMQMEGMNDGINVIAIGE